MSVTNDIVVGPEQVALLETINALQTQVAQLTAQLQAMKVTKITKPDRITGGSLTIEANCPSELTVMSCSTAAVPSSQTPQATPNSNNGCSCAYPRNTNEIWRANQCIAHCIQLPNI